MVKHTPKPPVGPRQIGVNDIAQMVGVQNQTARVWRADSLAWMRENPRREVPRIPTLLPAHDGMMGEKPWWWENTITAWAVQVGRMDPTTMEPRALKRPGRAKGTRNKPKGLGAILALA